MAASCIRVSLFIKTGSIKHLPTSALPRTSFKFVKIVKNGDYETADAWMRNFATKQSCIHNVYRADYIYLGSKVFCVNLGNLQMQPQQKVSYFSRGVSVSCIISSTGNFYFRLILYLFSHYRQSCLVSLKSLRLRKLVTFAYLWLSNGLTDRLI